MGYLRTVISAVSPVVEGPKVWESPASIDNSGTTNVSAALTDWLANTGNIGDTFRLRRGSGFTPGVYFVPQGIRVGRAMNFDFNGCWLVTGPTDGSEYPALWNDWLEESTWPLKRSVIVVEASDVNIYSSAVQARVQGAARDIYFRGGLSQLPTGTVWTAALEGQHGFRLHGSRIDLDLTNIAAEFVHGDGIYFRDNSTNITVRGVNLGPDVVGGTPVNVSGTQYLGIDGGLGGTINGTKWVPDTAVYPGIHHTGRHGIGTGDTVIGVVIDGIGIWRTGRATIDLEPAGAGDFVNDVMVKNTESGIHTLLWLAAAPQRAITNLTMQDNVCYEQITIDTNNLTATARHANWKLLRNRGGLVRKGPNAVFEVDRIDGLEIRDNFQLVGTVGQGINTGTSTNIVISPAEDIQFPVEGAPPPVSDEYMGLDETGQTIPDTNYTIPVGAIFMSPTGNDVNSGTQSNPVLTLNRAITLVPSGGTIVARGGIYRDWYHNGIGTLYGTVTKGITLQPFPHEQVWFDGADIVSTGWTSDGAGHWWHAWDTPSFGGGHYYDLPPDANTFMLHLSNWNSTTQAGDPQQVIFDGVYFGQVSTLGAVSTTTFFYDWNARRIYIGQNPTGHTVQLFARPCFGVLAGNSTHLIRGIGFRNYASAENEENVGNAAIYVGGGAARDFENIVITRCSAQTLSWSNPRPGSSIIRSVFAFNGANGPTLNGAGTSGARNDFLLEECIFNNNNTMKFGATCTSACASANMKNANMVGCIVRRCVFENAKGAKASGLWFDIRNQDIEVVNNLIRNNGEGTQGGALFFELSGGGSSILAGNIIHGNLCHGLKLVDATDLKVWNNTVDDNYFSMWLIDDNRTEFNTTRVEVVNNIFVDNVRFLASIEGGPSTAPHTQPNVFFDAFDYNSHHKLDGATQVLYRWIEGTVQNYDTPAELFAAKGWEQHGTVTIGGADPFFINKTTGDYRVRSDSVAFNSGTPLSADVAAALGLASGAVISRGANDWPGRL